MYGPEVDDAIRKDALERYPYESCGIVIDNKYVSMENVHEDPKHHFKFSVATHNAQAIIHSHPDGEAVPSKQDMICQLDTAVPWALVSFRKNTGLSPVVWFGDQVPLKPLIGRSFIHGVYDCWNEVRDWYRQEREITLKQFPRDDEWWNKGENMLGPEAYTAAKFTRFDPDVIPMERGDVMFCAIMCAVPNHCMVYVGNDVMLHHPYGRLSAQTPVYPWLRRTQYFVRYTG